MVQLVLGAAREIVINGDIKWFNTLLVSQYIYQLGYQPVVQKIKELYRPLLVAGIKPMSSIIIFFGTLDT